MFKVFIDTNMLVYAYDDANKEKQKKIRLKLLELQEAGTGVISTQILTEFYVCVVKKLGMDPIIAKQIIAKLAQFEVVQLNPNLINDATDCSILNQISLWDALVIMCAQHANCSCVWTEDLNHGQIIKNVKIENIFLKNQ